MAEPREIKIYLLPNLMTAGNLFCGFVAVLTIFQAMEAGGVAALETTRHFYIKAIVLIFLACLFDLLDGRVARLSGQESDFGREFDSLADVVSFGLAPALLMMEIVLKDLSDRGGEIIAFLYLLCGAMRLARFNCVAMSPDAESRDFSGFPIPAAAGMISSLTMLMLWLASPVDGSGAAVAPALGNIRFALPALMVLLAFMMFSQLKYPSFKNFNWRTQRSVPVLLILVLLAVCTVRFYHWMPAVLFTVYFLYGLVRPWISKRWRREIEDSSYDPESSEDSSKVHQLPNLEDKKKKKS